MDRDLLATSNADGYFVSLNSAWERVLGWSREELMSRPFVEFVHPDDVERTRQEAGRVRSPDYEIVDFENRYATKDGGWRWLRWAARSDGETFFAVAYDVTEEREERELLARALWDGGLLAYSQPIMDRRLGRVAQEELLARLRVNGDGVVLPREFIPAAERYGLVGEVDRRMVRSAVGLAREGRVAEVNLSGLTIEDESLTAEFEDQITGLGPLAERVVFEITESAAVQHLDAAREFAERMVQAGCGFALDDFGTGYGSLTYLRHLPVSFLKIDATFVGGMRRNPEDRAIVRSVVAIATELRIETVAEGVENAETLELLGDYGIDRVQGFLIGPPRPLG